jgi:hypothetical protein
MNDPSLIKKAWDMRRLGMFVSDIAKLLSAESGKPVTQISLWRYFDSVSEEPPHEIAEYEYPSYEDISYIFNKKMQQEKNSTIIKIIAYEKEITIRRDKMLDILHKFHNKEFTFGDVKNKCNDREGESLYGHWKYLLNGNYIEKTENGKFKFCERVKQWYLFGKGSKR